MALPAGTRFGTFEILGGIGAGGMGAVYRARDDNLGRGVGLKILPDEVVADRDRVARFEREARTLAALNHPNIAQIYDFAQHESQAFLVMELVAGQTVAERLRAAGGRLELPEALAIARQIAAAVE